MARSMVRHGSGGVNVAQAYFRPRTARVLRGADGLGRFGGMATSMGTTQTVTAAASNGGTVVTTTSPGGGTTTTAPGVTPPSVLKQKIGTAKGAHGYLVWAANALPPKIAAAVIQAALARSISYTNSGGQLGVFGDTSDDGLTDLSSAFTSSDASLADVGSVDLSTVASDAAPTSSWTSSMSNTVASVAAATLSAADAATVNSLNSTQLQRALSGQAPLNVAAGAGIGATAAGSGKTLLWGGAILGGILLLMSMSKGR